MIKYIKVAFSALAFAIVSSTAFAQSHAAGSMITSVVGTEEVEASSIEGTWSFSAPCVSFKSQDILSSMSSSAVARKGHTYLVKGLNRAGITEGNLIMTFNADSTALIRIGKNTVCGTYSLERSNLILTQTDSLSGVSKSIRTNVSVADGKLQIAMSAPKFLKLVQTISTTAASANTTLSTVSGLFSSVKGMYIGLQFKKE